MSSIKNITKIVALECFRQATLPYRWSKHRTAKQSSGMPLMVLYYHRVADVNPVAWSLSNAQFEAHIDWLEKRFEFISLEEVQNRMRTGNSSPAIHITFDDGYAENCDQALPLLVNKGIPVTYFVTLDNVALGNPFCHDQDAGTPFPVNTVEELRSLSSSGIEIGAHTRHHPSMGGLLHLPEIYDEMVSAKRELEQLVHQPIRYFAFPFGMKPDLSHQAAAMARADGIECVVSAYGGYNFPGEDPFHVQRIHGDPELIRIRNALTFDPRHLAKSKFQLETDGLAVQEAIDFYDAQSGANSNLFPGTSETVVSDSLNPLT
ncbi:polysaccharide deacetylase family protein [Mariniblastus sp.]|nr:polysaccharide deacetylase family protein [Mariniblastus sp.]MDA7905659.1 polysaccharide deacetylase family protein [Mariniblastus sp.]MDC0293894.1 polysaccharide deacetylase family protein [Mariniblastus sp.]MDC3223891.1 polysaccharide deacetylase family protein [Mariniblastus sp.]